MGSGSFCARAKVGEDRPFLGVWTKAGTILTFFHYGSTLFRKGRNFLSTNLIYAHEKDHMSNVSSFFLANLSCKAYNKIIAGGTPGIAFKRFLEERVATHFIK